MYFRSLVLMTNIVAVRREDTTRAREKRFSVQTIPWLRAVTAVYVYQYLCVSFEDSLKITAVFAYTARRDKICILFRQLPFVLGGPNGVKFLQAIWLWNSVIRQLKWWQSTQRRIETDSGTNQDRIQIQLIKWLPTQYLKRRGLKFI